jgi:hypothetical protein
MQNDAPMRYEINSINDFAKVPDNKLVECLEGFMDCVKAHRNAKSAVIEVARAGGFDVTDEQADQVVKLNGFIWIDDGIPGVQTIRIIDGDKGVTA